jgi:hypothetical protein
MATAVTGPSLAGSSGKNPVVDSRPPPRRRVFGSRQATPRSLAGHSSDPDRRSGGANSARCPTPTTPAVSILGLVPDNPVKHCGQPGDRISGSGQRIGLRLELPVRVLGDREPNARDKVLHFSSPSPMSSFEYRQDGRCSVALFFMAPAPFHQCSTRGKGRSRNGKS